MTVPIDASPFGSPEERLVDFINTSALSQAMCVAAELRIPDLLAGGPLRAEQIAQATACDVSATHRLLRALASAAVLAEREDGSFALTETGMLLRSDGADSLRNWVIWWGRYLWPEWARLDHSVKTGEAARRRVHDAQGFSLLDRDPKAAAIFNAAMAERSRLVARAVAAQCDFAANRCLADIGGGHGHLLATVLQAHPHLRGVLFERPHAAAGARPHLEAAGVLARCEIVTGDFFVSVAAGADVFLLKSVIHDWSDAQGAEILGNCRRALPDDGRLLLVEQVMPDRIEPTARHRGITRLDLTMLVGPGGRERTLDEFTQVLRAGGFELRSVTPLGLEFSAIEATPA